MDGSGQRRLLLPTQETYSSTEHSAYIRSILVFRSASSSPSKGASLIGSSHRCPPLRFNCKFLTHLRLMDVPITTGFSFSPYAFTKNAHVIHCFPFFPPVHRLLLASRVFSGRPRQKQPGDRFLVDAVLLLDFFKQAIQRDQIRNL